MICSSQSAFSFLTLCCSPLTWEGGSGGRRITDRAGNLLFICQALSYLTTPHRQEYPSPQMSTREFCTRSAWRHTNEWQDSTLPLSHFPSSGAVSPFRRAFNWLYGDPISWFSFYSMATSSQSPLLDFPSFLHLEMLEFDPSTLSTLSS